MASYKIHVNPNNQNAGQQAAQQQIVQQLAQNVANQQLQAAQAQQQAQSTSGDPLRDIVNEMVKNNLVEKIETPREYTLNDVLKSNFEPTTTREQRLDNVVRFLGSPTGQRALGNLFGTRIYNQETGRFETTGDRLYREEQNKLREEQMRAIQQQNAQRDLLLKMNDAYQKKDLQDMEGQLKREELEWKKQENALDRAIKQQALNAQIAHQRAMEGIARDRLASNNKQEKQLQKNMDALNSLNAVQSQMDRFSNSFKDVRSTKIGALMAGAVASKGLGNAAESNFNSQRTLLFNKIARELGGEKGVLSDQDIKRIEASLPALSDSYNQKKAKMQAIYDLLDDKKSQYGGAVSAGMANQSNTQPITIDGYTIEVE